MSNVHTRELLKKYQKDIPRKNKGILSLTQYFPVYIVITKGFQLKLSIFDPPYFIISIAKPSHIFHCFDSLKSSLNFWDYPDMSKIAV